ncbi:uncharacterized protein LOC122540459 isoform X3 [Chiloscyllium plagiosum]|uniref:uncharacterized protein LOC122540459 isoform X3 n=1 Tax=Chiloscyllium plagiosum TaxID=36176 RepID=UPI001CB7C8D6|nr:uncharacterized protein LOC122540459 isoform X3 [Chiloscyllium plagiosum]
MDSMESNCNDDSETPLPNLTPRHKELVPTPCGPMKQCSELSCFEKVYVAAAILSLIAMLVVTIQSIVIQVKDGSKDPTQEDFTISLIQLIGIVFCFYYVLHGIFQENRQELIAFVLSILFVVIRSVVNFASATPMERAELQIRFGFILTFGVFLMLISIIYLIKSPNMMAFRVSGAFETSQSQYLMVFLCFSMVTFDLQTQLCLCVLVLTSGASHISLEHSVILGVGICWAVLKAVIGLIAILKEIKCLVWIFMIQNLPELAYLGYLLYLVISEWGLNGTYVLEAGAVTGATLSVIIKAVLGCSMIKVSRCFGQGLHERSKLASFKPSNIDGVT